MNKKAFTFVELIVVVSIIIILGFIGTIGYKSYLGGINDSAKITQLSMIHKALQQSAALGQLPKPDNYVQVTQSGRIVLYQGDITQNLLRKLDIPAGKIITDNPQDFFYAHTSNKKYFQVGTFVEPEEFDESQFQIQTVDASEHKQPYFLGKNIGVFFDNENVPLHQKIEYKDEQIELTNLDDNITLRLSQRDYVTGSGSAFEKYTDLISQGGKGCSTDGVSINCMVYDDEREQGSGFGYQEELGTDPEIPTPPTSPTPGEGRVTIPSPNYPSDLAQMFRPSIDGDYNYLTDTWNEGSHSCVPADMSIVEYNPGDTIDTYISSSQSNTIFVFNEGNYTIDSVINTSSSAKCIGLIGKGDVNIGLSNSQSSRWTTLQLRGQNMIVAGLNFDGMSDGKSALTNQTDRGIYARAAQDFTIFNIKANNHKADGVRIYGFRGLLFNIEVNNNGEEGLQIGRDDSRESANLVNIKNIIANNNTNNGIGIINAGAIVIHNTETMNNNISGISLETVSRGFMSNIWTYNNTYHGLQIGNNLDVDTIYIDNVNSYNNNESGVYIDNTVDDVFLNNFNIFNNQNSGLWSAGSHISLNNTNIFNNNNKGISIGTQSNYTLINNVQLYKNQSDNILNSGTNTSVAGTIATDTACAYCIALEQSDIENGRLITISDTNWNYSNVGYMPLNKAESLNVGYGGNNILQVAPQNYSFSVTRAYGEDGVEHFNSNDPISKFQTTITELIIY